MRSNRASGTRPELKLRRALHAAGLRYRVQFPVPGAPRRRIDVAFTRLRIAVYLDGCFWHGCEEHPFRPKRNREYWEAKFAANRARDAATSQLLSEQGWLVLRFWEHEESHLMVRTIEQAVDARRAALHASAGRGHANRPGAVRVVADAREVRRSLMRASRSADDWR